MLRPRLLLFQAVRVSLHPVRHELRTLEQLHTFLRLRARERLGDQDGAGLHLLRQLRLGQAEVRTHPHRRGAVISRLRRLALGFRDHPDFDQAWTLPSVDAQVAQAMDVLMTHRHVDAGAAADLLTAYAEVARCDLVDAAAIVVASHQAPDPQDGQLDGRLDERPGDLEPA